MRGRVRPPFRSNDGEMQLRLILWRYFFLPHPTNRINDIPTESMPTVNCAFGPNSSFLLWIDDGPGKDEKPKYVRFETIVS